MKASILLLLSIWVSAVTAPAARLIDVAFTGGPPTTQTGFAATGLSLNDFWNTYSNVTALTNVVYADMTPSETLLSLSQWAGIYGYQGPDPMTSTYLYQSGGLIVRISNLRAGPYNVFLYGHGNLDGQGATFELSVGGVSYGSGTTGAPGWDTANWAEGAQYVEFTNVNVATGSPFQIVVTPVQGYTDADISGLQILSTGDPVLVSGPSNVTVAVGSTATLNVVAESPVPLTYQWQWNSNNIRGATNNSFVLANAQISEIGYYSVTVSNAYASATTSPAFVNVLPTANELIDVAFTGGPATAQTGFAALGKSASDFWNTYGAVATLADLAYIDGTPSGASLSLSPWTGAYGDSAVDPMLSSFLYQPNGPMTFTVSNLPPGIYEFYVYGHGNSDSENGVFHLFAGGLDYGIKSTPAGSSWDSLPWADGEQFGAFTNVVVTTQTAVTVNVEEGASPYSILSGLQIGYLGPLPLQPTVEPASLVQYVLQGSNANLSVGAVGAAPLAYQWSFNGVRIPQTNAAYDLENAQSANGGFYSVAVNNASGSAASAPIALNVITPPKSLIDVAFIGGGPPVKTGFAATGITSNDVWNMDISAVIPNLSLSDGTVTATHATVLMNAVNTLFVPASDPLEQSCIYSTEGQMSFWVGPLPGGTYDFYLYGHGASNNQNTAFALSIDGTNYGPKTTTAGPEWASAFWSDGVQCVEFTNISVGPDYSVSIVAGPGAETNAFLSGVQIASHQPWASAPFFLTQPASQQMNPGASTTFTVTVGGTGSISYQWLFNGTAIPGATNATLTVNNFLTNAGTYTIVASNTVGTTASSAAVLTRPAAVFATQAPDQSLYDASLRAELVPSSSPTTVWFEWGADTNYGQSTPAVQIGAEAIVVSNMISSLAPYTTYHYQAIGSNSSGLIYGGDVAFTTVPGFVQMGTNTDWTAMVLSSDGHAVAATRQGVVYVSTNLGASFLPTNETGSVFGISSDGSVVVAVYETNIYVSKDYGVTWITNLSPVAFVRFAASAFDARVLAGTDGGRLIYTSTNYGATWAPGIAPYSGTSSLAASADASVLYGGAFSYGAAQESTPYIYRSSNTGASWTLVYESVGNLSFGQVACSGDGDIVLFTSEGGWLSENGGNSWEGNGFYYGGDAAVSGDGETLLSGGSFGGGFFVSPNQGGNWYQANFGLTPATLTASADGDILATRSGAIFLSIPSLNAALQVNIEPPGAVSAGALWQTSGSIQERGGALLKTLQPGNHIISFVPLYGWTTPTNVTVNLALGQTNVATATYVQQFGPLQVNLSPPAAVAAGAKWQLDGAPAQDSGATVSASVGNHILSFLPASGWITPSNMTVSISNQAGVAVGVAYSASTSVQVLLQPQAAVAAGAKWQLDSGGVENSDAILTGIPLGSHSMSFTSVYGWDSPAPFDFSLTNGQTSVFTAAYTQQFGQLQVNITPPAAIAAGAAWQVDGGSFHTSGTTLSNLGVGPHYVQFSGVRGWVSPANATVNVAYNQVAVLDKTYSPSGSLQVNLAPAAAVAAGAHWQVDGGALQNSGAILDDVAAGNHTVSFTFAHGWTAPPDQPVYVASNTTAVVIGTYPPATVVTNANQMSLRNALASGGTVDLAINGTILLTNPIVISNDLVLDGTGYNPTLSGGSNSQIFVVEANGSLMLVHLTMANGLALGNTNIPVVNAAGGAITNAGNLLIEACVLMNNSAVAPQTASSTAIAGEGGAIFNVGNLVAEDSVFAQNRAVGGEGYQGGYIFFGAGPEPAAGGQAGGGAIYNSGTAFLATCSFFTNIATAGAGVPTETTPYINEGPVGTSGGGADGGAIYSVGSLWVVASTFLQNSVLGGAGGEGGQGQGLYEFGGSTYPGGSGGGAGEGDGGAICSPSGNVVVVNSTLARNLAMGGAGGAGGAGGSIVDSRGQASNGGDGANGANGRGGAICALGGTLSLTNVSCAQNLSVAGAAGAAGDAGSGGFGGIPGSPGLSGAPGLALGDSLAATGGVLLLQNSILDCAAKQTNSYGSIIDAGYNLNSDTTGFLTNATSFNGVDPMLGALGNYGGPTLTIPLVLGSPAINAADPMSFPSTDQRGFARPSGSGPDIGAFEYTFLNLAALSLTNGAVQFDLQEEWSNTAVIEFSSDLLHWTPLGTNTVSSNGVNSIFDTNAPSSSRFYRAIQQ